MKSSLNIQYTSTHASEDIDFLTQKNNQETPEFGEAHPFAFERLGYTRNSSCRFLKRSL
jgi:hypothetical protein